MCDIYYTQLDRYFHFQVIYMDTETKEDKAFCPRPLAQSSAEVRYTLCQSSID